MRKKIYVHKKNRSPPGKEPRKLDLKSSETGLLDHILLLLPLGDKGATPGSALEDHSWQAQQTTWGCQGLLHAEA